MGFKIIRHFLITCDGDCGAEIGGQDNSLVVVAEAARLGWRHLATARVGEDVWLCPECYAQRPEARQVKRS